MNGYVAQRRGRFYAVIYEGRDPVTGKERRKWHPAGTDRAEAKRLAAQLAAKERKRIDPVRSLTFGAYLTSQWLPTKNLHLATAGVPFSITVKLNPAIHKGHRRHRRRGVDPDPVLPRRRRRGRDHLPAVREESPALVRLIVGRARPTPAPSLPCWSTTPTTPSSPTGPATPSNSKPTTAATPWSKTPSATSNTVGLNHLASGRFLLRAVPQAISQHLAVLEDAGLIATERRGRSKFHYFKPGPLAEIAIRWPTTEKEDP